ncbi:MAG: hypothetical protein V1836_03670 [Candidatus Aenigmatarchaeota archaeon]
MRKQNKFMKKGMLAIDMIIVLAIGVIILAVVVGLVIFGGQQPGSDIAKQAFVRSCCQLNMPTTCTADSSTINCIIPKSLESSFGCTSSPCSRKLDFVASAIGITSNVKAFCGCG